MQSLPAILKLVAAASLVGMCIGVIAWYAAADPHVWLVGTFLVLALACFSYRALSSYLQRQFDKQAIWFFAIGIAASVVAVHVGHWLFVSGVRGLDRLVAEIGNLFATTVCLAIALQLGSLLFDRPLRDKVAFAGLGALCGLVASPLADFVAEKAWKVLYLTPKFERTFARICKDAHIDVRPMETRPTGVLYRQGYWTGHSPTAEFLLNESELQFVERERAAGYERLEVQGERIRRAYRKTQIKITPIATSTAPLEASTSLRFIDEEQVIVERKLHLIRHSDGSSFVSATMYKHQILGKECPEQGSMSGLYATNLLLQAMNMPEVLFSERWWMDYP